MQPSNLGGSVFCPLSAALIGSPRPMVQESRALGLFSAKERNTIFSKVIPHVVFVHSVRCFCSPTATSRLPDSSRPPGTEVKRCFLPQGFGDTPNTERFQWTSLPHRKGMRGGGVPALSQPLANLCLPHCSGDLHPLRIPLHGRQRKWRKCISIRISK